MELVLKVLIWISMIGIGIITYLIIHKILIQAFNARDKAIEKINKGYKNKGQFTHATLKMSRMGVMYRTHNYGLTPAYYSVMKIFVGAMIGSLAALLLHIWWMFPIGILIGYILVPFYFSYENKSDNDEMITDIYNTYANLKIQMSSGVYIRECLEYTYQMTKNKRFKEALGELILNFSDKTISSTEALDLFRNRFNNREIDKLSNLIASFLQYGINVSHANDIMQEIQSLIEAETLKTEHDIEMKSDITNFAFFTEIIIIVVYICFSSFTTTGLF